MDLQLNNKRALVTGSSSGIGAGIARVLAAEGVHVVIHGRDERRAHQVAAEIHSEGGRAEVVLGDLSNDTDAAQVAGTVLGKVGGIDILVNNAGGRTTAGNPAWLDIGLEDWRATYEQNVGAAVRMVRAFAPGMKQRAWGEDFAEVERRFAREVIPLSVARIGRPEDIGRLIAFLVSPLAEFVTGANFRIDGGQCRSVN